MCIRDRDNIAYEDNYLDVKKNNLTNFRDNFNNKNYNNPIIKNMWDLINNFNKTSNKIYKFKTFGILSAIFLAIHSIFFGGGYRYQKGAGGFLISVKGYYLFLGKFSAPWAGMSLGWTL